MASKKTKDENVNKCAMRNCQEVTYALRAKYCEDHAAERRAASLKAGSLAFRERKASGVEPAKRLLYKGELTKDAWANPKTYLSKAKALVKMGGAEGELGATLTKQLEDVIERQSQEKAKAKKEAK